MESGMASMAWQQLPGQFDVDRLGALIAWLGGYSCFQFHYASPHRLFMFSLSVLETGTLRR